MAAAALRRSARSGAGGARRATRGARASDGAERRLARPPVGRSAVRARRRPERDRRTAPRARATLAAGRPPAALEPADVARARAAYDLPSDPRAALGELQAGIYLDPESISPEALAGGQPRSDRRSTTTTSRPAGASRQPQRRSKARRGRRSRAARAARRAARRRARRSARSRSPRERARASRGCRSAGGRERGSKRAAKARRESAAASSCRPPERGRAEQQPPAGAQHAAQLREPAGGVGDVLDHLARPDDVEARVGQLPGAFAVEQPQVERRGGAARARRSGSSATSTASTSRPASQQLGGERAPRRSRRRARALPGGARAPAGSAGAARSPRAARPGGQLLPELFVVARAGGHRGAQARPAARRAPPAAASVPERGNRS